jgi:DNA polymerase V
MKAIVDCNNFYCSCERVFYPSLSNNPVVVLSNNDGCIISRSEEAKKLGVGMGIPYFKARHIIEQNKIAVFSSNYHLYGDMSMRVMDTLRLLIGKNNVEVYSVDEAFLDLDSMEPGEFEKFAQEIKATVEKWTGIPVSVGVAPTKTLAKIANHAAKKETALTPGVCCLITEEAQRKALIQTRVDGIWGVGSAYVEKLLNCGISSAWDLRNLPEEWAKQHMGGVVGVRLVKELKGEPVIGMKKELTEKKMITTTRMFGKPVTELYELQEAVATYISRAAEKLRRQHSAAKVVSVFIVPKGQDYLTGFNRGPFLVNHTTLDAATSFTQDLIKPAKKLVSQLFEKGIIYKKAGVMLSSLVPDESVQGNLFVAPGKNLQRVLMDTIDNMNFGMRGDTLKFASTGMNRNWKMRQELKSKRHSTKWEELKEVR